MNTEILIENVLRICEQRKVYPTKACEDAGVGKSFIANMRKERMPSVEKVAQLAAYLGVSTSDLVGDAKEPDAPKDAELSAEFSRLYADLSAEQKDLVYRMMQEMRDRQ